MVLSLAALGVAAWRVLDELSGELLAERRLLAQSVAASTDDLLRDSLEGLYRLPAVSDSSPLDARRVELRSLFLRSRLLVRVYLLGPGGELVWEDPPNGAIATGLTAAALEAARTGRPALSTPTLAQGEPERRLHVVVPLRDLHGSVSGYGAAALDPRSPALVALLKTYAPAPAGSADLVDVHGRVVASSEPSRPGAVVPGSPVDRPDRRASVARDSGEILVTARLSFLPLSILLRQEEREALAPTAGFRRRLAWLVPLLVATALVFGWGAARSLTQPLAVLTGAAERIAGGDVTRPIPPLADDEVGRLGRSLETMRQNLQGSMDEIRKANEELEGRVAERTAELQHLTRDLQDREERRAQLIRKLITAQEDERKRIARDLHDQTCQTVAALGVGLETALTIPDPETSRAKLVEVKALAARTLDDLHRLIFALRPSVLDDLGLESAVRWYAARFVEPSGVSVRCEVEGLEGRLPPELETAVFRAIQEALTNVVRHADAETVLLQLSRRDNLLTVEIEDDGRGFDVTSVAKPSASGRGLGLLGMRERVELMGGHLTVESASGTGTRLLFTVPVPLDAGPAEASRG